MTDHEALNAAITAAGLDPNNHLVRKASQVLVEKYNEARNAEAEAWNVHAKGCGEELRYTEAGAKELADRLRTIVGVKEPTITPLFPAPSAGGETVKEWQPIETAPKDGTEILGYGNASWQGKRYAPGRHVAWFDLGKWWGRDSDAESGLHLTHWQPLPACPVTEKEKGR